MDELLKQWANEQGFQTWSQDHAAVLRNLGSWLNKHSAQKTLALDGAAIVTHTQQVSCPHCGRLHNVTVLGSPRK